MAMWKLGDPIPGFGSATTGGAGGSTYTVTSGADDGPGTLRDAVNNGGRPLIVRFDPLVRDVTLTSGKLSLEPGAGNISITGEDAGGVQVRGKELEFEDNNIIVAHLKMRRGTDDGLINNDDCFRISGQWADISNIAVMQCEALWSIDQIMAFSKFVTDITLYRVLMAEGLHDSGLHDEGTPHSNGPLFFGTAPNSATRVSMLECAMYYNWRRNPRFATGKHVEVANCHCFGMGDADSAWNIVATANGGDAEELACLYNHYQYGPESFETSTEVFLRHAGEHNCYILGNLLDDANGNPLGEPHHKGGGPVVAAVPAWSTGDFVADASGVLSNIQANVGAYPTFRDSATTRILNQVANRTGGIVDAIGAEVAEDGNWPVQEDFNPPEGTPGAGALVRRLPSTRRRYVVL